MRFVFVTDLHFKASCGSRTGDLLTDLCTKLQWVIDYCNANGAVLLLGGDVFDRASVSDEVKVRVFSILRRCVGGVVGICGNHDRLYDNPDFNYKTSWQVLVESGLVRDLAEGDIDFGGCVVSCGLPVVDKGKPSLQLYHGFLNREDGLNTFSFSDIADVYHDCLVLLGHDHQVYSDAEYSDCVRIVRPGSFQRCKRDECHVPSVVDISLDGGRWVYSRVIIPVARDIDGLFITQDVGKVDSYITGSYDDIIRQLSSVGTGDVSFRELLGSVAAPDVCEYLISLLDGALDERARKKQNL